VPITPSITAPITLGDDALKWLEHHGITPHTPTLRSSDYDTCISNPFQYYLTRRLGITPALSWSKALNRGTYFHILFALFDSDNRTLEYSTYCKKRIGELNDLCDNLGIIGDKKEVIIDREYKDQASALAWFDATESVKLPASHEGGKEQSFQQFLRQPHYKVVGSEVLINYANENFRKTPFIAQIDLLLRDTRNNTLWILDAKTTSKSAKQRLAVVKKEFQTQHYMHIVNASMPKLIDQFNLPPDTTFGGMIHIAVEKPSISFGQKDRDYRFVSDGKRKQVRGTITKAPTSSGHAYYAGWAPYDYELGKEQSNKYGTFDECVAALHEATGKKPEKEYFGEPNLNNYINRCRDWYMGTGDYQHEAEDRKEEPKVNWITTSHIILNLPTFREEYWARVKHLYHYAICKPFPINFLSATKSLIMPGMKNTYASFYLNEVKDWPEIMAREQFITHFRDEELATPNK